MTRFQSCPCVARVQSPSDILGPDIRERPGTLGKECEGQEACGTTQNATIQRSNVWEGLRSPAPEIQQVQRLYQRLRASLVFPNALGVPVADKVEALGLWPPHPPAFFPCQGLDQSPGRVACDLWPHKRSPRGQRQPLFTSLNFIYRANEGSPTPKAGQASLKSEAAHPLPPCPPLLNPKASV